MIKSVSIGDSPCEPEFLAGLYELLSDNPDRAREVCRGLSPEMFSDDTAADAFRLAQSVLADAQSPTMSDVARSRLYPACRDLVIDVVSMAAASRCGYSLAVDRLRHQLRADHSRRMVERAAGDLSLLVSQGASPAELAAAAKVVQDASSMLEVGDRPATLLDAIDEYLRMDASPTIPTQFSPFDRLCGGLPVGGLTVVAAPPSVGKSALALQLVLGAMEYDRSLEAVWCLGEMTMEAFARRSACHWSTRGDQTRVPMSSAEQRSDIARGSCMSMAMHVGQRLRLVKPPLSIEKIEAEVIQSKAKLIVIDYVQLVELSDAQDRRSEVDGIVRRLRRLSLEHSTAVLAVSNIAKAVSADTRIGAIGKETSELDFAADVLLLGISEEREDVHGLRSVKWACKKNRHGQCIDADTMFDGRLQTFTDAMAGHETAFDNWG